MRRRNFLFGIIASHTPDNRTVRNRPNGRKFLVGSRMGQVDNPPFHILMNYYPDFTINNSFMDPSCSHGESIADNDGYPVVIATSHYQPSLTFTAAGAAADRYRSTYLNGINTNVVPHASTVYAFRVSREWASVEWEWAPYWTGGGGSWTKPIVDPATWVAGFRNYVNMIRGIPALASVKIAWDYPCLVDAHGVVNPMNYYPGDSYVDIISCDVYFVSDWYGGSSSRCWNRWTTYGSLNLNNFASFAADHNKPIAIWEWGDNYGDGYCINQFGKWMKSNHVIAHSYWDVAGNYPKGPLQAASTNVAAYVTQFGNTSYTGSDWQRHIPLPSSKPPGF